MSRRTDSDNEMEECSSSESIVPKKKNENNDDEFIEGMLQDIDFSSKIEIPNSTSRIRHIFLGSIFDSGVRKRTLFSIALYVILLLISVGIIEPYIYDKRDRLLSDLSYEMKRPFDNIGEKFVSAIYLVSDPDNMKFIEMPIPQLNSIDKNDDTCKYLDLEKKWKWTNLFSENEHLYRIADCCWKLKCISLQSYSFFERRSIFCGHYMPCFITVPKGVEFNAQIGKDILNQAVEFEEIKFYQYNEYDSINTVLSYSNANDYFYIRCEYNYNDSVPDAYYDTPSTESTPFDIETIGTDPFYDENGQFTGYYLFSIQVVGPYNILWGYKKECTFYVTEYDDFGDLNNGALKDRILYYGLVFTILTSILTLYLLRITRKLKANKLILTESLRERLLRYADPIKYMNAAGSLKVAAARDISEKLLDTSIDDSQVEEIADDLREKLGINLITEQEKSYLIDLCKSFLKQKRKQLETRRLVNNLFVLIADSSKVGGKDYKTIQRIAFQIIEAN